MKTKYVFVKAYAIRQSSKGWSDIVWTADTKEAAEALVKQCYTEESHMPKSKRHNYRIEEIYNLTTQLA